MELHLETFPVTPVINDVAKTIDPMTTKNANRIVIECPADFGTIHADQTRFRQSLLNLASNANKSHVLHRDYGLVGEGRSQLDLFVSEWSYYRTL